MFLTDQKVLNPFSILSTDRDGYHCVFRVTIHREVAVGFTAGSFKSRIKTGLGCWNIVLLPIFYLNIDLGVAFEQSLMLKTPERIPSRLTRDIFYGMGVTGVEGVFRRCCKETLSVMRTNNEALLKIVEEINDDLDANLEDSDEDEYEGNKDTARSLMRVKQKLDGYEEGEMRSVRGQVYFQANIHNISDIGIIVIVPFSSQHSQHIGQRDNPNS